MNWYVCKEDGAVNISFDLIPQEAVDFMRKKSFWISGVENQLFLQGVQDKLEQALAGGQPYKEFAAGVQEVLDSMGYSGSIPFRLDTIFRTNLFSAYSIAQQEQVAQVQDRFPAWQYVAILDSRTRSTHRALNGDVFYAGEGPMPPIDFNCRCMPRWIHISQMGGVQPKSPAEARQLVRDKNIVKFDMRGDFEKWIGSKKSILDPKIRSTIEELA